MRGYFYSGEASVAEPEAGTVGNLARWEAMATDAVGQVIEFWGFKRNHGRVWALLYLRGEPLSAGRIEEELALSKGGVSMLLRDLERWGVVVRVREPSSNSWHYQAETDLLRMVRRVIEERESGLVARIRADLVEAKRLAQQSPGVNRERLARLDRMNLLALASERALKLFLRTAQLDVTQMVRVFRASRDLARG
jgi:DNA-binding transcriptional regulator GbsR (MarR family)